LTASTVGQKQKMTARVDMNSVSVLWAKMPEAHEPAVAGHCVIRQPHNIYAKYA